jgi:hypothetical protein
MGSKQKTKMKFKSKKERELAIKLIEEIIRYFKYATYSSYANDWCKTQREIISYLKTKRNNIKYGNK